MVNEQGTGSAFTLVAAYVALGELSYLECTREKVKSGS